MSGDGALDEDRLGGLDGGREEPREGGSEDLEGPEIEEFLELCRDPSYFILFHLESQDQKDNDLISFPLCVEM